MSGPATGRVSRLHLDVGDQQAAGGVPQRRASDALPTSSLPPVLRVEELARLLRVNRKTAYEVVASGKLPGVRRLGRSIRIDRDAVLEWLSGQVRVSRIEEKKR
jgi:excisionase family DNA binding protein